MSSPSPSPYVIGDAAFAYQYSPETAQKVQASSSGDISGFGNLRPLTIQPELFTLLPRQCSFPSGHISANRGANDSTRGFSPFVGGEVLNNRSLCDSVSCLEKTNRFEVEDELVPQKHVDVLSDGVYLNTASQDSFIGVSLSPSVAPTTFNRSRSSVQLDGPPRSPPPKYNSSSRVRDSNIPNHISRLPNPPSNIDLSTDQHARQLQRRGAKALPATLPGSAYSADVFDGVPRSEPATRRSSRTSVRTYSSLQKSRSRSPEHDFAVIIVERESSGECSDYGEPTNHKGAAIQSNKHSIATKAANIIRDWKVESNSEEQQRVEWEAYGKRESKTGSAFQRTAWRKDLLLRDCQHQIQTKLRIIDSHVFILQKLPPAAFKTEIVTCAHPYCPAPQKRSPPASYRLSLEPKENLKRAAVPREPLYKAHIIKRRVGKVEEGLRGKGEDGVTWYCLTCAEDLWRGVGMLQDKPHVKGKGRDGSGRKVTHVNNESLRLSGEPSSFEKTHLTDLNSPSPLRKKAKLFIRGPRKPTGSAINTKQLGDVEDDGLHLSTKQASQKAEPGSSRPLSTREEKRPARASNTPNRARDSSPLLPNEEDNVSTGRLQNDFKVHKAFVYKAESIGPRPPLNLDGTVDDMPPPKATGRKTRCRPLILQAAMRVGAMVTEEEAGEVALFESPRRQRTASLSSMPHIVPFASIYPTDDPASPPSLAMGGGNRIVAQTTPTTTKSAQPTTTPPPTSEAAESTTLRFPLRGTDSGYITEISGDESNQSGPLDKSPEIASQTLRHRLRRAREVELIVRSLEWKNSKTADSKKRKVLHHEASDPLEPSIIFRLQPVTQSRARSLARRAKGRTLPRVEETYSKGPRLPADKGTRTCFIRQRIVAEDSPEKQSSHVPVGVPEYWCICQRPDNEQDMLQCDGEYCLVGWFHLRCAGLAAMPDQDEPWYCHACIPACTPRGYPPRAFRSLDGLFDSDSDSDSLTQSPLSSPTPTPSHAHPPIARPPPVSSSSEPALAPIAHFIHPETRSHPSGHYSLSSPQLFALRRWKAVINYQRMFHVPRNRMFMERNGLDYSYPDDGEGGGEVVVDVLPDRKDVDGDGKGKGGVEAEMGIMEIGGLVVEVTRKEVEGRELSQVLGIVDGRVEAELVRLGWHDEGIEREKGNVRLRLKVGGRHGDGEGESGSSGKDERELDKEGEEESGKVRLKLRVKGKEVGGFEEE